jgi:hypothetical protein
MIFAYEMLGSHYDRYDVIQYSVGYGPRREASNVDNSQRHSKFQKELICLRALHYSTIS